LVSPQLSDPHFPRLTTVVGPYVVSDGNTFYENKAYLSYVDVYATNACGTVGKAYTGGIIPVASSNIYSMSGYHYELYNYAWQMNFADLNDPIPFSAYDCMYGCAESGNVASELVDNLLNGQIVENGLCADPGYIMWDPGQYTKPIHQKHSPSLLG